MLDWINNNILTILIFSPLLGILILAFLPANKTEILKTAAMIIFLVEAIFSLHIIFHLQNTGVPDRFLIDKSWIQTWNVKYLVAVDGVSSLLIVLTTLTLPLALMGTWNSVQSNLKFYLISLMALETGMVGVFCALDLFLFYVFWEVMLIPMYFLIGMWGGEERVYAALKFFIYTVLGSLVMLVAILILYHRAGATFNLLEIANARLSHMTQVWIFLLFAFAFAIKIPLFPFHTWLPDAHVQAPTVGSIVLAGILLKMGVYGFFRIGIPLMPFAVQYLQPTLMGLAVIGIIYGALVAFAQTDMKKLVAFSSVSHMGVVMLGVFSLNPTAMTGGLYQMFAHAVSTGALFMLVGMLYDRTHTRAIQDYSGLAKRMPLYAFFFLIVTLSSIGMPLTTGFVGEFLTLVGAYQVTLSQKILGLTIGKKYAILGATGVILGAVYMLWLYERIFFGEKKETKGTNVDLNLRETTTMAIIVIFIFWLGISPRPLLEKIERPVETALINIVENDGVALTRGKLW